MGYLPFLIPILIVGLVFYFISRARSRTRALLANGIPAVAQVLEIHQTGTVVNNVPMMSMRLRVEQAGMPSREVQLKQLIGLGNIPRPGEQVVVAVDPTDPTKVAYGGLIAGMTATGQGMNSAQTQDAMAISPTLRDHGKLGIGTILSITPMGAAARMTVEVDSIVEAKRTVTIEQVMTGFSYEPGDRAYLLVDPANPESVALMPLSMTGGQKLMKGANRLDPLVLDPQLKREGMKAQGTVISCNQVPMGNAKLEAQGMQRWHLQVHILPDDGTPAYDGEQTISFTSIDKVQRICVPGAQVPIRYDAHDPQTFCTDSMSMGYPDPYEAVWAAMGVSDLMKR